ncbi:hypothetical protein FRB90_008490 [Tulasnella sp. 427]|nr:hypothetical protein FRB90_008490 [Tulasnella sp. 427]
MPGSSSRPIASSAPARTGIDPTTRSMLQNHPPPQLRSRTSTTTITRPVSPPIPPSLIDSPFLQDPNSPFRRDYSHPPAGPTYNVGHDRLNLLDTVPMGEDPKKYLERRRGSLEPTELPPDDIGVAGAPKSARTADMTTIRSTRPGMVRGNSWILQQQQLQLQQQQQQQQRMGAGGALPPPSSYPSISPSQSTVRLPPPNRFPPSTALPPISTPFPVPARSQQQQQPSASRAGGASAGTSSISAATR